MTDSNSEGSSLVPIASYRTKLDAEVAGGLLDQAGIPYVIESGEVMALVTRPGGTRILVSREFAERALEVLEAL